MRSTRNQGAALALTIVAVVTATAVALGGTASAASGTTTVGATLPGGSWGLARQVPGLKALLPSGYTPGPGATDIAGTACTSPGNCVIVGFLSGQSRSGTLVWPFVDSETDGTWGDAQLVRGVASLGTGNEATLSFVSCGAPGDCAAAGIYLGTDQQFHAFLVTESSGAWGPAAAIDDAGLSAWLTPKATSLTTRPDALSCPAAGECTVLGDFSPDEETAVIFAFTMDEVNGIWSAPQPVAGVPGLTTGADWSVPSGLSCAAPGDCTAGGQYGDGTASGPFVVSEADHVWGSLQQITGGPGLSTGAVTSVSCPDATDCTVAGSYETSATTMQPFTAGEVNGTWGQAQALSVQSNPYASADVACWSPGHCLAAGTVISGPSGNESFATWTASESGSGTWGTPQPIPGIPAGNNDSQVRFLSCLPAGECTIFGTAAGKSTPQEQFIAVSNADGKVGAAKPVPVGAPVLALACSRPGYCLLGTEGAELMTEATAATVALTPSPSALTYGGEQAGTLTVTVSSPAGGTPSGTVTVADGSVTVCVITLAGGKGSCRLAASQLRGGVHHLTAAYGGDANYVSASSPGSLTITRAKTTTRLSLGKTAITYGHESEEKLTISVSHVSGVYATGKVTIKIRSATLCTITLSKGGGSCTLSAKRLKPGSYRLTASYPGDSNYARSTAPGKTLQVAAG